MMSDIPSTFICSDQFAGLLLVPLPVGLYQRLKCTVDGIEYKEVWACDVEAGWIAVLENDDDGKAFERDGAAASRIVTGKVELSWSDRP